MELEGRVSAAFATGAKVSVVAVRARAEKRMFFMSWLLGKSVKWFNAFASLISECHGSQGGD